MDADFSIAMENINVQIVNFLPTGIPERIIQNHDGSYTILINAKLNYESQLKSYEHAIDHIKRRDFDDKEASVQRIELETHDAKVKAEPTIRSDEFERVIKRRIAAIKKRRKRTDKLLKRRREERAEYREFLSENGFDIQKVLELEFERRKLGEY